MRKKHLLEKVHESVLKGKALAMGDALSFFAFDTWSGVLKLAAAANSVREKFAGNKIHLCSILNARSGRCPEDCAFCAQSSHYSTGCRTYPLLSVPEIFKAARQVERSGLRQFCIVTSGRSLKEKEFETLLKAVKKIKTMTALECNCSLGTLSDEMAEALAEAGVSEYNHNLETAPDYFSRICTTHTFNDRVKTVRRVKTAGMKSCCGGIIGMGESRKERIALAFSLKKLNVDCVTVNVLNPRPGTPLEKREPLAPMEIIKTVAIFRLILPSAVIKIAGGREVNLRSLQPLALLAGGNGMITGGYLTTSGQGLKDDLQMVKDLGFKL